MEANLKKILRSVSLELRHILEGRYDEYGHFHPGDLERRLNEIGIWRDRSAKAAEEMPHLSVEDRSARTVIDAYILFRKEAGVPLTDAVAEFVRESAYTWANRLFALRCMEARTIIDEIILQKDVYGGRSLVHNRFARKNPEVCTGDDDGLFVVLFEEFLVRAGELPTLFDPKSPAIALRPSVAALKRCVGLLSGRETVRGQNPASDDVFSAPDAFGWTYQYWNAEEKDRVFEAVRTKKKAKIEGADIIPATQLYTEPYMVKFLVQNSLGATWMGMNPESKLHQVWEYYDKSADRSPVDYKPVKEITFLDPAIGSGHFLLEGFDIFYAMYEEEGLLETPEDICSSILNYNLFGIDIDGRAVQIAAASLWMKAKERAPELDASNISAFGEHLIATNIRLPKTKDHLEIFLKKHPEDEPLRLALETVFQGMENANELGSLLQIEKPVENALKELKQKDEIEKAQKFKSNQGEFWDSKAQAVLPLNAEDWNDWRQRTIERLKIHFSEEAEVADFTQAFFGRSARVGLSLFNISAGNFTVIVANPPYMGSKNMELMLKNYISAHYPSGKRDLYVSFILRNLELLQPQGLLAMVTPDTWTNRTQLFNFREEIFSKTQLKYLVCLDRHAFEEADPPGLQVLFVMKKSASNFGSYRAIRCIGAGRSTAQARLLKSCCNNVGIITVISTENQNDITNMPMKVVVTGFSKKVLEIMSSTLNAQKLSAGRGISTGNNDRFIRFWWESELYNEQIKYFIKALNFSTIIIPNMHRIRWRNNGFDIKEMLGARLQNMHLNDTKNSVLTIVGSKKGILASYCIDEPIVAHDSCFFVPDINKEMFDSIGQFTASKLASILFRTIYKGQFSVTTLSFIPSIIDKIKITDSWEYKKKLLLSYKPNIFASCNPKDWNEAEAIWVVNSLLNAFIELNILDRLKLNLEKENLYKEVPCPVGWYPLIDGYHLITTLGKLFENLPDEIIGFVSSLEHITLNASDLDSLKHKICELYQAGIVSDNEDENDEENDEDEFVVDGQLKLVPESIVDRISSEMQINPISAYLILKEGIQQGGWKCLSEEQRLTADRFTVTVLQFLGHRWPMQIGANEPVSEWADRDGIIPLTDECGEKSLFVRIRDLMNEQFPGGSVNVVENEFAKIVGISLEKWLVGPFFKRHVSQFKKRPIAWHIQSNPYALSSRRGKVSRSGDNSPAFAALVYYHKLNSTTLLNIRKLYLDKLRLSYETELRTLEGASQPTTDQSSRKIRLEGWIEELKVLDKKLELVTREAFGPEKMHPVLRQYAIDDAMLSLIACWLKRLSLAVQSGPLKSWQEAAEKTELHQDFPQWLSGATARLDSFCSDAGPKAPEENKLPVDPTPADLAPIISSHAAIMVKGCIVKACDIWWKAFDSAVLLPVRQKISDTDDKAKLLEEERDSTDCSTIRKMEIERLLKQLKTYIKGLKKELSEKSEKAKNIRRDMESWQCKEAGLWEGWLATQPLFDKFAQLDATKPPPSTIAEFIAQESAYYPDINDGVRVNIAPLQKAGLLAADVIASKDLDKAISDRADWRADERRWCREGKLPQPGWWQAEVAE